MGATAKIEWEVRDDELRPVLVSSRGQRLDVGWAPQPGSQEAFLSSPVYETLYEGTRGPGKTDALLMDFAQDVGQGWGSDWRGILFRQTYPQLADVIAKSKRWFPVIWPRARYNQTSTTWTWPDGESLAFRHMQVEDDYWNYHGHAYPWIAFEELTTWSSPDCYLKMMACSRSTRRGMPRKFRSTTNPFGRGHNWVKQRFRLPLAPGRIVGPVIRDSRDEQGKKEPPRVAVRGTLSENRVLLTADPDYPSRISAAARSDGERNAWLHGSWDVVSGGMFDDVWSLHHHVLEPFEVPRGWRLDRSLDWGSSKPFSVGWWAESDGTDAPLGGGRVLVTVPGDLFRVREWYGCKEGKSNVGLRMPARDVARGILERERRWFGGRQVLPGPADTAIFSSDDSSRSVAMDMRSQGVDWTRADNSPGSRVQGWERVRSLLSGALPTGSGPREDSGLFVFSCCEDFPRVFPVTPRCGKRVDDVDTESEDHLQDEVRYRCYTGRHSLRVRHLHGR